MLDLLIVYALGVGSTLAYLHFFSPKGPNGSVDLPTTLDGFGQILTHGEQALLKRLDAFEANFNPETSLERIKTMIADALNELKAAADAKEAKAVADAVAAATAPAVAAQEATDEQAVRDFTAANFAPAP